MYVLMIIFFVYIICCIKFKSEIGGGINLSKDECNILKGICCICIFLGHLSNFVIDKKIFYIFAYTGNIICGLFFFLSSYGLMSSLLTKKNYLNNFIKNKLLKIIIPYFFIIFLYWIILIITNNKINVFDYIILVASAKICGPLWFINTLILMYILFYLSFNRENKKKGLIILFSGIILFMFITYKLNFANHWYISVILFWFGAIYKYYENNIVNKINFKYPLYLFMITIVFYLSFFGNLIASKLNFELLTFNSVLQIISSISFSFLVFILLYKFSIKSNMFKNIGLISYELYLIHPLVLNICDMYFKVASNSIYLYIIFFTCIILSIVFHNFFNVFIMNSKIPFFKRKRN